MKVRGGGGRGVLGGRLGTVEGSASACVEALASVRPIGCPYQPPPPPFATLARNDDGEQCGDGPGSVRTWARGRAVTMDTSFMHETLNGTDSDRYVLIMRHWHPGARSACLSLLGLSAVSPACLRVYMGERGGGGGCRHTQTQSSHAPHTTTQKPRTTTQRIIASAATTPLERVAAQFLFDAVDRRGTRFAEAKATKQLRALGLTASSSSAAPSSNGSGNGNGASKAGGAAAATAAKSGGGGGKAKAGGGKKKKK